MSQTFIASVYTADPRETTLFPEHLCIMGFNGVPEGVGTPGYARMLCQLVQEVIGRKEMSPEGISTGEFLLQAHKLAAQHMKERFHCELFFIDDYENDESSDGPIQNISVLYRCPTAQSMNRPPFNTALFQLNYGTPVAQNQKNCNMVDIQEFFKRAVESIDRQTGGICGVEFGERVVKRAVILTARHIEQTLHCKVTPIIPHFDDCIAVIDDPSGSF